MRQQEKRGERERAIDRKRARDICENVMSRLVMSRLERAIDRKRENEKERER